MARKKSIKRASKLFLDHANTIEGFLRSLPPNFSAEHVSWAHEYAIIRLYREFELLILAALIGAINNDSSALSERVGIPFPKHLRDEVCEYILLGEGYFDFKGRDGLIQRIKKYIPDTHYLVKTVRDDQYKMAIERLCSLRNLAAHQSAYAKAQAKKAIGTKKISSAGAWLKKQKRFEGLLKALRLFAADLEKHAPY